MVTRKAREKTRKGKRGGNTAKLAWGTFAFAAAGVALAVLSRPSVTTTFQHFAEPSAGTHETWEAHLLVSGGRPAGIRNLGLVFSFPFAIDETQVISDGGCTNLVVREDRERVGSSADSARAFTGRLFADRCPSRARPIIAFQTTATPPDMPASRDSGTYELEFDWVLPLFGTELAWTGIFGVERGSIPARPQRIRLPFGDGSVFVSSPPFYDIEKDSGAVVVYIEKDVLLGRSGTMSNIWSISEPGVRADLSLEGDRTLSYSIRWPNCPKLITGNFGEIDAIPFDTAVVKQVRLDLGWTGCTANFRLLGFDHVHGISDPHFVGPSHDSGTAGAK